MYQNMDTPQPPQPQPPRQHHHHAQCPPPPPPFWQLPPQTYKRQFSMSVLSSTTVYDESPAQPNCPSTPTPISPSEIFACKEDFVESLVDTAVRLLETQWKHNTQPTKARLVPLKLFIEEILKRSRTSFSTLQLCLLYLVRFKHHLPAYTRILAAETAAGKQGPKKAHPSCCCRRMFLSALIVAAKYVQDRNYSNKAWSKISGLAVDEITLNEREFLKCLDWKLYVPYRSFVTWSTMLLNVAHQIRVEKKGPAAAGSNSLVVIGKNADGTSRFAVARNTTTCTSTEFCYNKVGNVGCSTNVSIADDGTAAAVPSSSTNAAPLTPPVEIESTIAPDVPPQMYPNATDEIGFYYPSPGSIVGDEIGGGGGVQVQVGRKRKLEEVSGDGEEDDDEVVRRCGQGITSPVW